MKSPLPFLLYTVSLGLFGWAGWTVYEMLPLWKEGKRQEATTRGQSDAMDRLGRGRGQGPKSSAWSYTASTAAWWAGLKNVNLIGKLPPPPPEIKDGGKSPIEVAKVDLRPLGEVIELVSLFYDGEFAGKGGQTHVIVRFKPEANVEPPEWWVRQHTAPAANAGAPVANTQGRDTVPNRTGNGRPANAPPTTPPTTTQANRGVRGTTAMPTSTTGGEVQQTIWIDGNGDPRRTAELWPVKSNDGKVLGKIRLVGVASDALAAQFVRELPPTEAGKAPEIKEEELVKASANLPADVMQELRRLQGRSPSKADTSEANKPVAANNWVEQQVTTRLDNKWNIGRDDEKVFREQPDQLFEQVNAETWVSRTGKDRGVMVRNADPQLAQRFGVAAGDVLIEVNGRKVESKAQAMQFGKGRLQPRRAHVHDPLVVERPGRRARLPGADGSLNPASCGCHAGCAARPSDRRLRQQHDRTAGGTTTAGASACRPTSPPPHCWPCCVSDRSRAVSRSASSRPLRRC